MKISPLPTTFRSQVKTYKKPSGFRPADKRASFTSANTLDAVGAEAEVPSRIATVPFQIVMNR